MKSTKRILVEFIVAVACLIVAGHLMAEDTGRMLVGNFSSATPGQGLPEHWQPLNFEKISRHTRYDVIRDNATAVVRAVSQAAASGLKREIRINPRVYPIITWRWKVTNVLSKGDLTQKEGDDFAARIYISFAYDPDKADFLTRAKYKAAKLLYGAYPPLNALNYVWANKAPVGTSAPNAYTDKARMIVLQSGEARANRWMVERRNVYEDYIKAFGYEPPAISGVAIMTDTDNTGQSATAYYGDIWFGALHSAGQ